MIHRDESEERIIHRLEAFSDIIIGFSLAQLALSMAIPKNGAIDFFRTANGSAPLVAFVITFALVCGVWWAHHRLFTHYFVPVAPMIVLNFLTLACVGLSVYSVQLMIHEPHTKVDFVFYESFMGAVYGLLAIQNIYGWLVRRSALPSGVAIRGLRSGLMLGGVAIIFLVLAFMTTLHGWRASALAYIGWAILAYGIALRVIFRLFATKARAASPLKP